MGVPHPGRAGLRSRPGGAYASFLREIRGELFPTREALFGFYGDDAAYARLRSGVEGDNLLRKYKTLMLSSFYGDCVRMAIRALVRLSREGGGGDLPDALTRDLELFLMGRDVRGIFERGYVAEPEDDLPLTYDLPAWDARKRGDAPLEEHRGRFVYRRRVTEYMQRRLEDYSRMHRDPELSLQVLYRDGGTADFWPVWERRGRESDTGTAP